MNTQEKRTKFTALGKKYYPSRDPTKHRNGHFPPKNGLLGTVICFQRKYQSVLEAYRISGNRPHQYSQCFDS